MQLKGGHSIDYTVLEELQTDIEVVLAVFSQDYDAIRKSDCIMLVKAISSHNELVTTCLNKIEATQHENIKLKDRINTLEEEVKRLSLDRNKLVLGQVALEIEKAIVSIILDKLIGPHHYIYAIQDMEHAIYGEGTNYADVLTEEGKRVAENDWRKLKQELQWSSRHFRYMKSLKQHRISVAHPRINEAEIKHALENWALPESEAILFNELFTMYKMLNLVKPQEYR